ncbi:MAG: hypothetical protein GY866_39985 [Proteobacteria bacterium]|nr:hypothetical protein [Pseudomonadota bacterium]
MRKHNRGEIVFFGRITAGITHELQNVLAIIQESAGLMEDLLAFSTEESDSLKKRLEKSLTVVNRQLLRGVDLITHLNRFAHSPDQPLVQIDLQETIEQMTVLSRRFAALKKVVLKNHPPDQPIQIASNLVQVQMALFLSMECCLSLMAAGGQLDVALEKQSSKILILMSCEGSLSCRGNLAENLPGTDLWKSLDQTLRALEGSAEFDASGNGIVLSLAIEKR